MSSNKAGKETLVESLKKQLVDSEFIMVVKNIGLTVSDSNSLRSKIRSLGDAGYKVAKNTLIKLSIKDSDKDQLSSFLTGTSSIAYSKDPVGLAKVLVDFMKDNDKLILIAGILSGKLLNDQEIKNLSKLPSLPEILANVVAYLNASASELRRIMLAPAMELHRIINLLSTPEGERN